MTILSRPGRGRFVLGQRSFITLHVSNTPLILIFHENIQLSHSSPSSLFIPDHALLSGPNGLSIRGCTTSDFAGLTFDSVSNSLLPVIQHR